MYKIQFDLRNRKSTEHAILDLHKNLKQAFEIKEKTICIFLDLLMPKLEHYFIRGPLLFWSKSYRTNRKQTVKIEKIYSNSFKFQTITWGFSQGSVLGPVLFLIYLYPLMSTNLTSYFSILPET